MAKTAILAIRIVADATKAAKGLQGAAQDVSKFDQRMQRANRAANGVIAGLGAVGAAAFNEANKLQQAGGAVESVFGKQAGAVNRLARDAAKSFGLARSEYSQTAAVFGAQLKNMGVAAEQLVPTTDKLIGLGSDLAATFGGSTSDAVAAIGSLMRGEADPIERYGVGIKQVDVNARLAAQGQDKLTGAAKKTAETEARLALLFEQTTAAQGQRAREAGTAASRQEVAMARMKNAGAALGAVLLPVVAAIAVAFAGAAEHVERNATTYQRLAIVVGALAVAVKLVNVAVKAYRATAAAIAAVQAAWTAATVATTAAKTALIARVRASSAALAMNARWQLMLTRQMIAQRAAAASAAVQLAAHRAAMIAAGVAARAQAAATTVAAVAQRVLNAVMRANPIGLLIAGIMLAVGAFILLYRRSSSFRSIVQAVMKAATTAIGWVVSKASQLYGWFASRLPGALTKARTVAVTAFRAYTFPIRTVIGLVSSFVSWCRDKIPSAVATAKSKAVAAWNAIIAPIRSVVGWIQDLIDKIRNIKWPEPPGWMKNLGKGAGKLLPGGFPGGSSAGGSTAAPLTLPAVRGGDTFIIQGALDPVAVGDQIAQLLRRRDSRKGIRL